MHRRGGTRGRRRVQPFASLYNKRFISLARSPTPDVTRWAIPAPSASGGASGERCISADAARVGNARAETAGRRESWRAALYISIVPLIPLGLEKQCDSMVGGLSPVNRKYTVLSVSPTAARSPRRRRAGRLGV